MKTILRSGRSSAKAKLGVLAAIALAGAGACQNLHAQFGAPLIPPAGKYAGGGFIPSTKNPMKKATFGFNLEAVDNNGDGLIDRADAVVYVDWGIPGFPPFPSLVYWYVGKGQLQYNDHEAGVQFHLDHDALYELNPDDSVPNRVTATSKFVGPPLWFKLESVSWIGTYRSREGSGEVTVRVTSEGDVFGNTVDKISINVSTGPYAGYVNFGELQGGNIEWHPAE